MPVQKQLYGKHFESGCWTFGDNALGESVRSDIVDFLRRELVGPDPGLPAQQLDREEILRPQDPPRLRYSVGVLFPRKAAIAVAETATETEADFGVSGVPEA